MHWTEQGTAVARVGVEMQNRGWTIYGYKSDRSDSMTDYYDPARWDGVAVHPECPSIVVGVKSRGRSRFYTEAYYEGWPVFQATPKGKAWHVEKDGHILTTGIGLSKCASYSDGWQKGVARFCDAIEQAAGTAQPTSGTASTTYQDGVKIEHDRDWTWVFFPAKPDEATRERLKGMGAHWGRKRGGWYLKRHVPLGELAWLTANPPADPIQVQPGGFHPRPLSEVRAELTESRDNPDPKPAAPELEPVAEAEQPSSLPERWTADDIRYLLGKLEIEPVLVADAKLEIPTIHDLAGEARHLGFGFFEITTPTCKLQFDGGGAMQRTPSGRGWTYLHIDGDYAYDTEAVRARLQAWLRTANETPSDHSSEESKTAPLPPTPVETEPAPVKNPYLDRAAVQLNRELKRLDKEIKTQNGAMDFAYELVINDRGARLDQVQREMDALLEKRQQVVDALLAQQKPQPVAEPRPEVFSISLAQWLERDDHLVQRSGSDMYYVHPDGHRTLWAGIGSKYAVIVRQHRCEVERAIVENRPITADVANEYPDLAVQADEKDLTRPPVDDSYRPVWMHTRREFSVSHPMSAGGVPIGKVDAAKERYHEIVVQNAIERGYPVPDRVRKNYACTLLGISEQSEQEQPVAEPSTTKVKAEIEPPAAEEEVRQTTAPPYTGEDIITYETRWDVYFETGAVTTIRKAVKRIDSVGVLRVAFERADCGLSASTLEERRKIIERRIRQLEKAA